MPDGCKAQKAGGTGVDSGLSQLGQILGQLLGKLMQQQPPTSSTPPTNPTTGTGGTGCTGSYFQTSDVTQLSNPCAQYTPATSNQTCPSGTTGVYPNCISSNGGTGAGGCDLLSQALGTCGSNPNNPNNPVQDTLTATPTSGAAPLLVSFKSNTAGGTIDFGDGTTGTMNPASTCATCAPASVASHTYASAGTFNVTLQDSSGGSASASVTVTGATNGKGTLTATPASGSAPLLVSFNSNTTGGTIDFGDGTTGTMDPASVCATCAASSVGSHTYASAGTFTATLTTAGSCASGSCAQTVNATVTVTAATNGKDTLTATPASGTAPLLVSFKSNTTGGTIDFGDGTTGTMNPASTCATCAPASVASHTYASAGTFNVTLQDSSGGSASASVTVIGYGAGGGNQATSTGNGTGDQNGSANPLTTIFFGGSNSTNPDLSGLGVPALLSPTLTGGTSGNIFLSGNGATVVGGLQDVVNNTGVAGFYGADTFNGAQPQGLAAQMCQSRPWASGFFASILPASFFDSLCTWQGYPVGMPPAATSTPPIVQLQQTQPAPATTTPKVKIIATSTSTSTIKPQVQIWAVPPTVPLATRTSIFWNTQGVTNCTETSPDGSFNQNSLSGGSATVPLMGATTFSISCFDTNGNPVTGYVTVNLSI